MSAVASGNLQRGRGNASRGLCVLPTGTGESPRPEIRDRLDAIASEGWPCGKGVLSPPENLHVFFAEVGIPSVARRPFGGCPSSGRWMSSRRGTIRTPPTCNRVDVVGVSRGCRPSSGRWMSVPCRRVSGCPLSVGVGRPAVAGCPSVVVIRSSSFKSVPVGDARPV